MRYTSNKILPANVKSALDMGDQLKWMEAFNKSAEKNDYVKSTFDAWESVKASPSCRHFEGWLSTDHVDNQNDVMNQKGLFDSLTKHVIRGGVMVDVHTNRIVGSLYGIELRKYDDKHTGIYGRGVIYQDEPYFDSVWDDIKKGTKNGFSIGGFAIDWKEQCDKWNCHREVTKPSIHEVSVCTKPADPEARMTAFNYFAKADDKKVTIDIEHLKKDKAKFKQIISMLEEMINEDNTEVPEDSDEPTEVIEKLDSDEPTQYEELKRVEDIYALNNKKSAEYAEFVKAIEPNRYSDSDIRLNKEELKGYEQAIRMLNDASGLPVKARLAAMSRCEGTPCKRKTILHIVTRVKTHMME